MTESVSFRITRTAEDVAQTINALSHRLVRLEQRLESLELQVKQQQSTPEMPAEELARLDDVDRVLMECQSLLKTSAELDADASDGPDSLTASADGDQHEYLAA